MNPGDTFTLADRSVDSHLWIVVSDPAIDPERVLFVSMTSYDITKEKVCLLDVGDHPFIRHRTCIAYDFARLAPLTTLIGLRDRGTAHDEGSGFRRAPRSNPPGDLALPPYQRRAPDAHD